MKAQTIYNFVNEGGASGTDMHEFFAEVLGEPSPSGYSIVPKKEAKEFMANSLVAQRWNSPSLGEWCEEIAAKYRLSPVWR